MQQTLNKTLNYKENGDKEITYVFEVREDAMFKEIVPKIKTGAWQIFPSGCASLTCIPFGLMLGWPSPTYPTLLGPNAPVPISLDQSAMIAGFLMFGVSFGTIFSSKQIGKGPKYGIIVGNLLIMLGWFIMWQVQDIYGLLASRLILGAGHGYAMGQIKFYIQEMTEESLCHKLTKHLNFYVIFGFIIAFAMGPFVGFRLFSLISLIISVCILFLSIFLPSTPRELIRVKKIVDAKKLLVFLKPDLDPDQETQNILQKLSEVPENNGFTKIWRNKALRINFLKLTILLFCQQYSGAPPTMVYAQILFAKSHVQYPEYFAIGYSIIYLLSTIIGTYVTPKYNKKSVLLMSSFGILLLVICKIFVIYYEVNKEFFNYTSVIIIYLYIAIHTAGLGSIPISYINKWFPKSYTSFVTKYFIILFSIFALTVTKIFQVLMGLFGVTIPFCLFSAVIIFGIIFILIFIPFTEKPNEIYEVNTINSDKS